MGDVKLERDWLINLRNVSRLTQQDVADETGLSRSFYSQIECGERGPSPDTAKLLGEYFGFDWTRFYD